MDGDTHSLTHSHKRAKAIEMESGEEHGSCRNSVRHILWKLEGSKATIDICSSTELSANPVADCAIGHDS